MSNVDLSQDAKYLEIVLKKIYVCRAYKPKFGQGKNISFEEFKEIYGGDPFYWWFGLDHPLMYAAHKAAGGITSLYRQIGIGCERLFRQIIRDQLGLAAEQARWSYKVKSIKGKERTLSLDGRIEVADLSSDEHKERIRSWMDEVANHMDMDREVARVLKGAVFEVRQGYKSKDSKRQNADIGNAGTAYTHGYLPVVSILSNQIDGDVAERYINSGWLLLRGHLSESATTSTYAFCKQVLG
ncbi:MAG: hypothetical protein M3430_19185 [Acidobacteriota bacterium]|nr:hypothetical protein [Acidobacteriota bacterium]